VLALYRGRRQDYGPEAVVLIRVERARPLVSPAYDRGRTEEDVRAEFFAYYDALNRPRVGTAA
jgi:hypothetical protein